MGMEPLEDTLPFGPFRTFYEDADRDFYVAGLIESEQEGDLGELFSTIILEQFLRLRDSGNDHASVDADDRPVTVGGTVTFVIDGGGRTDEILKRAF